MDVNKMSGTRIEGNVIACDGRIKLSIIPNETRCETLYERQSYYFHTILCEENSDTWVKDLMTIWFRRSFGGKLEGAITAFGLSNASDRVPMKKLSYYSMKNEIKSLDCYMKLSNIQREICLPGPTIEKDDYMEYRSLQKIRRDYII